MNNYRVIDKETYYRIGVFRHFSEDCKCSTSMTARVDVTELAAWSKETGTKFYINFLYILTKVLNSRDDYRMGYLWQTNELICYEQINPTQYIFHEDTETCTPVYSTYSEDYDQFYRNAREDAEKAKQYLALMEQIKTVEIGLWLTTLSRSAELLRDYPGWAVDDQARFKQTLRTVFYPHIMTGDAMRWGNQGLTAYHAVLAMAVYLDDTLV